MLRCLTIGLMALAAIGPSGELSAAQGSVVLRLERRGGLSQLPDDGRIVARHSSPNSDDRGLDWPLRLESEFPLPADAEWILTCRGQGIWCPEVPLPDADGARVVPVHLPVYPAVIVRGRLQAPSGGALPQKGIVQGASTQPQDAPSVDFSSELLLEERAFSFAAPRGTLDLRFAIQGFAPAYLWQIRLEPEQTEVTVGTVALHPGASLAGWVRDAASELPVEGSEIHLVPFSAFDEGARSRALARQTSDATGFFQFTDLTPGRYSLQVQSEGFALLVLEPLEILPGSESLLGALAVTRQADVRVELKPPTQPDGKPWLVRFEALQPHASEKPLEVVAGSDGTAVVPDLRPVEYAIAVIAPSLGTLAFETRVISPDTPLFIAVPLVTVDGVVLLEGEPLRARVALQVGVGDRVEFQSDEEGKFGGWMRPPERPWLLASVRWEGAGGEETRDVELRPGKPEREVLEIALDLPDRSISGLVVDAEGLAVAEAIVTATPTENAGRWRSARTTTDAAGRFRLAGLERGILMLQAGRAGKGVSDLVVRDLTFDRQADETRLVLWPVRQVQGRLMTSDGEGVAGAWVDFVAIGSRPASTSAVTGPDGAFEVEVPLEARRGVVTVAAPSHLLWSGCVTLDDDSVGVRLPPQPGGTLRLTTRGRSDLPPATLGEGVVVTADGGFLTFGMLAAWQGRLQGQHVVQRHEAWIIDSYAAPSVAIGSYAALWSSSAPWELATATCGGAFSNLEWVTLGPGGEAVVEIDLENHQRP